MMDAIFPKRALTRERDTRLPNDYRLKPVRGDDDGSAEYGEEPDNLLDGVGVNLHKLEDELSRNRLNEIAALVRALTYGEMMDLAQAIWKTRPQGPIDQQSLPMMLHLWSSPATDGDPAYGEPPAAAKSTEP
jgi:hypothetical protein